MADMLVRLYALPDAGGPRTRLAKHHIEIRRALPGDGPVLERWVRRHFVEAWAVGCAAALTQRPVSCFIAVKHTTPVMMARIPYNLPAERLLGFACYDVASRGMVGAMGVHPDFRGWSIGTALLLTTLHAMADEGYLYAIIGWAGPTEFYTKTVGATLIPASEPGGFRGPLSE